MDQLKKITIAAIIALGATEAASAAMYAPATVAACTATGVTIPCEKSAWDIGIGALYVLPTGGASDLYAERLTAATGTPSVTTMDAIEFRPKWSWGFKVDGSYHWGTGSDISVNWTHFSKKTDLAETGQGNLASPYLVTESSGPFDVILGHSDIRFDAINGEFGQHVDYGPNVSVRYHAGIQYAQIRKELDVLGTKTASGNSEETDMNRKYNGFGPRIGADAAYDFGNGFSLVAHGAASILMGTSKIEVANFVNSTSATSPDVPVTINASYADASHRQVVPAAEARLGARYNAPMSAGDLSLELGWQVAGYSQPILTADTVGFRNENFGFGGAYLDFKWLGNA